MSIQRLIRAFKVRVLRYPDIREVFYEDADSEILLKSVLKKPDLERLSEDRINEKVVPEKVDIDWPSNMKKPLVGLMQDTNSSSHWTRFARFLRNNEIPFEFFDHHRSDWIEVSKRYDVVVWSPEPGPAALEEIRRKIYILESKMSKICYPSFYEALMYDNKVFEVEMMQLENLPVAKTLIFQDYREVEEKIPTLDFPVVVKLSCGASGNEVKLLKTPEDLRRYARSIFSIYGRKTGWAYHRQKNYVYVQEYVAGAEYDLRIMVIGRFILGYFRCIREGDFRASGSHLDKTDDIPIDAIKIALETYYKIGEAHLAVDMVRSPSGALKIVEISPFIWARTPVRMAIDLNPGLYFLHSDGKLEFRPGAYWVNELALKAFFEQRIFSTIDDWKAENLAPLISHGVLFKDLRLLGDPATFAALNSETEK